MARKLETIAKDISKKVTNETKTAIELGELLTEARDGHFTTKKGKVEGANFLAWVAENFNFKKAQTYAYIKIASVFNTPEMIEKFSEAPVSLLHAMSRDSALIDAADKAVEEGEKVDLEWFKAYKKALAAEEQEEEQEEEKAEPKSKGAKSEDTEAEGDVEVAAYVSELEDKVELLEAQLSDKAPAADMSAFFKAMADMMLSLPAHAVLYLDPAVTTKAKVNKAKRDLLKIYDAALTGDAGEPAREAIKAAADSILGVSEPAVEEAGVVEETTAVEEAVSNKKKEKAKKKAKK